MLFFKAVIGGAFLACYSYSLSIPSKDVAIVSRDVVATSSETSLSVRVTSDISPRLAGAPKVVLAAISGTVAVGTAACIFGQVVGCAAAAIALGVQSVVGTFFYLYKVFQKNDPSLLPTRSIGAGTFQLHAEYVPTPACDFRCKLNAVAGSGEWTTLGNITTNGTLHDIHYRRSGGIHGVRAVPDASSNTDALRTRQSDDTANNNGFIIAYYWEDNTNEYDWSNWDQADDDVPVANDIASFIVSSDSALICADLEDSDGAINAGVMGTDNDNQEDVYTDTYLQQALDFCAKGDGLAKL